MISDAAVMTKPEARLLPSRWRLSGAVTLTMMLRSARSFMSSARGQVTASGSRSSSLPWNRWESIRAESRLCAEVMAWKSPWKWRLIFSAGSICELPPPAAPPFIPKTGPSEGSREVMMALLPMLLQALDETDGGDGFAFAGGGRGGRRHQDQLATTIAARALLEQLEAEFGA